MVLDVDRIEAERVDYNHNRHLDSRRALLHDILKEPQDPGVSRLIFVHERDEEEKDQHTKCNECRQHLVDHWGWSEYMFRDAVVLSNGYAEEAVLDEGLSTERTVKHLRFLVKMVDFVEDPKLKTQKITYDWVEMSITMRQHQNGSISIICFGVPKIFHTTFAAALKKADQDPRFTRNGERIAASLMQEIVRLYDESVWAISKIVRKVEKKRFDGQYKFEIMHELLRHAIHTTEVLEVAVDSLTQLDHSHSTGLISPSTVATNSPLMHKHFDFWCRLLKNFQRRSRSNENRLQNEIHLALNLVTQRDSDTTIQLSKSASRDSAAMRTIAAVTLVFLPATFVATLFGMSFFNFQNGEPWSMTSEFWIFWAVAVPLTIVTVMIWIAVQVRVYQKTKKKWNDWARSWAPDEMKHVDVELGIGDDDGIELGDRKLSRMATLYRTWTSGRGA